MDVTRLPAGTKIIVETTQGVYELVIDNPQISLVSIRGTDPRLKEPITGQLVASHYDHEGRVSLPNWIGKNLRMHIKFLNCEHTCSVSLSARVEGDGWHYDVF